MATADIIALPSLDVTWAKAQLPAKLMDAMMHGRVVVASDIAPIRWALGEPALLVPAGDVSALVTSLKRLADPELRAQYSQPCGPARSSISVSPPAPASSPTWSAEP